jgi:hypothetical protein
MQQGHYATFMLWSEFDSFAHYYGKVLCDQMMHIEENRKSDHYSNQKKTKQLASPFPSYLELLA